MESQEMDWTEVQEIAFNTLEFCVPDLAGAYYEDEPVADAFWVTSVWLVGAFKNTHGREPTGLEMDAIRSAVRTFLLYGPPDEEAA